MQRGLNARVRLLQLRHSLRHLFDRGAQPAGARFHHAHAFGLGAEQRDTLGDAFELRRQAVRFGADVGDAAARLLQRLEPPFHGGKRSAEIDDPLPDRVEPLILELEAFHRPLHVVAQRAEAGA